MPRAVKPVPVLKRYATEVMAELRATRKPTAITVHGEIAAYLVDPETFEAMEQWLEIMEWIAMGERDITAGRTVSHAEAKKRMAVLFP